MGNYTWTKSIDDTPANMGITGVAQGSNSPIPWTWPGRHQYDRGPSEFDHRHRFVLSYVHDPPRLSHANAFVRTTIGGGQITGIFTLQRGGPLTIPAGKDQRAIAGVAVGAGGGKPVLVQAYPNDLDQLPVERCRDAFCGKDEFRKDFHDFMLNAAWLKD